MSIPLKTQKNPSRKEMITSSVKQNEVLATSKGTLVTWNKPSATGRCPEDTYIVKTGKSEEKIDWNSKACNPLSPETFDSIWEESMQILSQNENVIELDRVIGADEKYALPVKCLTYKSLAGIFVDNMFRPIPKNIEESCLFDKSFTILFLPDHEIESEKYKTELQANSTRFLGLDVENCRAIVRGTAYLGTIKKTVYTAMNYYCIDKNILPLHCSANEGKNQDVAILLGLSGTGKTTLSTDKERSFIGDDEHGWSEEGIANFENGCYAKLINLDPQREPEIHRICFENPKPLDENGIIIENAMMYPNQAFDLYDKRLTENSRASYPISEIEDFVPAAKGPHPKTILFLTADAYGVIPPVAKLSSLEAQLWFLMGYTSKLAGTETGVTEPKTAFSRFFGEPFMIRNPQDYTNILREKIETHDVDVYLINTGWSGGPYGVGERMDIKLTRKIVDATFSGELKNAEYEYDSRFHFSVPKQISGVDSQCLNPKNTWADKEAFEAQANKLAAQFADHFDKKFTVIGSDLAQFCPGKG